MADALSLRGLRVFAHHGVFEEEAQRGQEFLIDVTVVMGLQEAGRSDDLTDTLDYGALAVDIAERVQSERWLLIERVAERIAELVLEDDRVAMTEVTVHKPNAPIPLEFGDVAVTIQRTR